MGDTIEHQAPALVGAVAGAELMALAERVEAAAGPDRALDADIAVAVDFRSQDSNPSSVRYLHLDHGGNNSSEDIGKYWPRLPRFTASIEAAWGLVPEWWAPLIDCTVDRPVVELFDDPEKKAPHPIQRGCAATAARALTAAALRARAAQAAVSEGWK